MTRWKWVVLFRFKEIFNPVSGYYSNVINTIILRYLFSVTRIGIHNMVVRWRIWLLLYPTSFYCLKTRRLESRVVEGPRILPPVDSKIDSGASCWNLTSSSLKKWSLKFNLLVSNSFHVKKQLSPEVRERTPRQGQPDSKLINLNSKIHPR
jgi:hypothetical protein